MYKRILTAVTILSVSQIAYANNSTVWNCVDSKTLQANSTCLTKTFETKANNEKFFSQLKHFKVEPQHDAFATVTFFPQQNLIQVTSLERKLPDKNTQLIARR